MVDVRNNYVFPQSDGSNGQVLKTDGSGNLSFSAESGGSSLSLITEVDDTVEVKGDRTFQVL